MQKTVANVDAVRVQMLEATLRHAVANTRYYKDAFAGLRLDIESLDDLERFPLLQRDTLARSGTDLLVEGTLPEYVGITSGTTFSDSNRAPLLHYQTEDEHAAWIDVYASLRKESGNEQPLMLRLTDPDRGVEIAGAFRGCFSLPLENPYHFELIISLLRREWSFPGCTARIMSLSGVLDSLQLLTLCCMEKGLDPKQFNIRLISSSGWQMTSRWRGLLENYWQAEVQDVYGLSEAPGMFASRCTLCSHYHFSPLSIIEVLRLDDNRAVTHGPGRIVVTCLLPIARAQPIIRYDSGDVIDVTGACEGRLSFDYVGRKSQLIVLPGPNGPLPVLSPLIVTEVLDSLPDFAIYGNLKADKVGLRSRFGWPRYSLSQEKTAGGLQISLDIEMRWSPMQFPGRVPETGEVIRQRLFSASPLLAAAAEQDAVHLEVRLREPGSIS